MSSSETGGAAAGFPRPFGKYTLLSHLAIGGMADVFLAHFRGPAGFEKDCVIKRILPHLGQDHAFVQMFLDEARLSARLSHPNIVQIFDLGQAGDNYFLAMEYVDGVNLEQILEAAQGAGEAQLPWPVSLRVVSDVAAGLDYAHKSVDGSGQPLGIVHRDVSPSNVMVSWGGAAKILDFGIAKAQTAARKSRTEVGTIKGKVPYMSPEQLQGLPLDGRSDVFSLGVILYEITCGSRPFLGETTPQLTVQIMNDEPQPPELLVEGYPPRLQQIVLRALAKRPEDRWQTARDFQMALEAFLADEHVSCTAYDVEAYLRRVYPQGRGGAAQRRVRHAVSGTEMTEVSVEMPAVPAVGRVATPLSGGPGGEDARPADKKERLMKEKDGPAAGPGRVVTGVHQGPHSGIGDLGGGHLDELEQEERRGRKRGGGGMMIFLGVLVVATAGGLFALRDYVMGKDSHEGAADLSQPAAPDLARAVAPDLRAAPDLAPAAAAKAPVPVAKEPEAPRAKEPPKEPVRDAAPKAPKAPKRHAPDKEPEAPRSLPRLEPDPE